MAIIYVAESLLIIRVTTFEIQIGGTKTILNCECWQTILHFQWHSFHVHQITVQDFYMVFILYKVEKKKKKIQICSAPTTRTAGAPTRKDM